MPRSAVLVAIAGFVCLFVAVGYPAVAGLDVPVPHRLALGLLAALPAVLLPLHALRREMVRGDEREDAARQETSRVRRDFARLKDTVEQSRHKVVQVTSLINALSSIAKVTGQSLETSKVVAFVMEIVERQLGAKRASLWLVDPETGKIAFEAGIGWTDDDRGATEVSLGRGIIGWAIANQAFLERNAIRQDPTLAGLRKDGDLPSVMCAPLVLNNEAIGALNIEEVDRKRHGDLKEDVRLLEFVASLAAMAIKNARVFSEARDRANTDGLTRLATHRHFQETFDAELRRAERYGDFLSVIITDIDHFKKFNDTYGHQIGDLVLRETATVFRAAVREMDLVARYGGEEFACLLPNTNKAGAVKLAERLRQAVEARQYQTDRGVLRVAISLGVATFPVDAKDKVGLIKLADGALYQAKESGRNRVCYANQRTPDPTA